jgi:hypothetical protein
MENPMTSPSDFRTTWLWWNAFASPRSDVTKGEQEYFRDRYLDMRDRAAQLVSRIVIDMPGMTVHDVTHLDALWETASLVAEGAISINPAEAFVFGGSILLHDSAMSLAAYPGGLDDIEKTVVWKDVLARYRAAAGITHDAEIPNDALRAFVIPDTLRRLHASQAEVLATQYWQGARDERFFLIEDSDLRAFYGPSADRHISEAQ